MRFSLEVETSVSLPLRLGWRCPGCIIILAATPPLAGEPWWGWCGDPPPAPVAVARLGLLPETEEEAEAAAATADGAELGPNLVCWERPRVDRGAATGKPGPKAEFVMRFFYT